MKRNKIIHKHYYHYKSRDYSSEGIATYIHSGRSSTPLCMFSIILKYLQSK